MPDVVISPTSSDLRENQAEFEELCNALEADGLTTFVKPRSEGRPAGVVAVLVYLAHHLPDAGVDIAISQTLECTVRALRVRRRKEGLPASRARRFDLVGPHGDVIRTVTIDKDSE
jgi:hypothetical protein